MVVQAFLLHRIAAFSPAGIGVATLWYTVDTVLDYFVPVRGDLHHTYLPVEHEDAMYLGANALGVATTGAVVLLVVAVFLALLTHVEKQRATAMR